MWQTDISVCKGYGIDNALERSLRRVGLRYERANVTGRHVYSVIDETNRRDEIESILIDVILEDYKYNYFLNAIGDICSDNERLLVSEMLFFDSKYEREYLERVLSTQYEYSIDGIVTFKLGELTENWDYLIGLFNRVAGSNDGIVTLAGYIHESAIDDDKKIYMTEKHGKVIMFDVKSGEAVREVNMMPSTDDNILMMLISTHASELYVDRRCKFKVTGNVLSKVISVKYV